MSADNSIRSKFWWVSSPQPVVTCVDCGSDLRCWDIYGFYPTPDGEPISPLCKADFDQRVKEWKKSELPKLFPNLRVTTNDWATVYACMDKK